VVGSISPPPLSDILGEARKKKPNEDASRKTIAENGKGISVGVLDNNVYEIYGRMSSG